MKRHKRKHRQRKFKFARGGKHRLSRAQRLKKTLSGMSALEAIDIIIEEFKTPHSQLQFASGRVTTIEDLLNIVAGSNILASDIGPIKFWGGPPNTVASQHQGTLLTVVLDRILYQNTILGSYADLLCQ